MQKRENIVLCEAMPGFDKRCRFNYDIRKYNLLDSNYSIKLVTIIEDLNNKFIPCVNKIINNIEWVFNDERVNVLNKVKECDWEEFGENRKKVNIGILVPREELRKMLEDRTEEIKGFDRKIRVPLDRRNLFHFDELRMNLEFQKNSDEGVSMANSYIIIEG
jgi:hypothetical protein